MDWLPLLLVAHLEQTRRKLTLLVWCIFVLLLSLLPLRLLYFFWCGLLCLLRLLNLLGCWLLGLLCYWLFCLLCCWFFFCWSLLCSLLGYCLLWCSFLGDLFGYLLYWSFLCLCRWLFSSRFLCYCLLWGLGNLLGGGLRHLCVLGSRMHLGSRLTLT